MSGFREFVLGGVLVAPFVPYAIAAAVLLAALRPLLRRVGFEDAFSNPPMVMLCVYVGLLTLLIVLP